MFSLFAKFDPEDKIPKKKVISADAVRKAIEEHQARLQWSDEDLE
jgi:hypothetical protein